MFLNPRYAECAHKNILLLLPHPLRHVERRVMMMIIEPLSLSRENCLRCARGIITGFVANLTGASNEKYASQSCYIIDKIFPTYTLKLVVSFNFKQSPRAPTITRTEAFEWQLQTSPYYTLCWGWTIKISLGWVSEKIGLLQIRRYSCRLLWQPARKTYDQ